MYIYVVLAKAPCFEPLVLKFFSFQCQAAERCSSFWTTNWALPRGILHPQRHLLHWHQSDLHTHQQSDHDVIHMARQREAESESSCPVQSETDLCGNSAVNDYTGSRPVRVVHVSVDGRFSSLLNLHAVSGWSKLPHNSNYGDENLIHDMW